MQEITPQISYSKNAAFSFRRNLPGRIPLKTGIRMLCLVGIVLGLIPITAGNVDAAVNAGAQATADIDSRWLPWIGSWRLVPATTTTEEEKQGGDYILAIRPGADRTSVSMKASRDKTVLFDDSIVTNGLAQPLKENQCSGWYRYSWSETGKRLLFTSKSSCADQPPQEISGLWIINQYGEWLDIQLLQRQDDRIITLRRYRPVAGDGGDSARYPAGRIQTSRSSAGMALSMNEVIELNRKVAPEILEAALVEYHEPFPINSRTLIYLSDAGVPSYIVDLMVALSFPEKFTVERSTASIAPVRGSGDNSRTYAYYIVDPFFPWCWTPYTWSFYFGVGWGWGWGGWGGWYPPYYPGYPVVTPVSSGRLVAGRGYTKVYPRGSSYAKLRGSGSGSAAAAGSSRGTARPNARTYPTRDISGSTTAPPASGSRRIASPSLSSGRISSPSSGGGVRISSPSGGGRVSSPSRSSAPSAPSASQGGYSGSSSGGRRAKQR